ncbi:MAG: endonuclease III domain-containing protein [Deltaproteobacteria bacterium]|nr:endonuclease III domain-containing protein [Deltaproteobacteria bacterium]
MSVSNRDTPINVLTTYYDAMFAAFGPQGWWPARTRFEVIVGAILTQNTAWTNVEAAIKELKAAGLLRPEAMHRAGLAHIARCIRSAGYFNVKARRLKNFTDYLFERHGGSLDRLFKTDGATLRSTLLGLNGIGPETADSIILYAAGKPEFVIDAYTKRIFSRHGLISEAAGYDEVKALFTGCLPPDAALFNEYHALIVVTAKEFCKSRKPVCEACPLKAYLGKGAKGCL